MVITVTLNPAIDKTLVINNFEIDKVNVSKKITTNAGGKGINVSKGLKILGMKSIAITCLGGLQGKRLEYLLEREELKSKIIWLQNETRVNTKIIDLTNKTCTDINEIGPAVNNSDICAIKNLIKEMVCGDDIVVLSGSLPEGASKTLYKDIISELNLPDLKIVIDTSGELLKESICLKPWLIKPNISELRELTNKELLCDEEIIEACEKLISRGVKNVLVSLGDKGIIFVSEEHWYKAYVNNVNAKSTVGAGDTVVAGFIYGSVKKMNIEDILRIAVASSTSKVVLESGNPTLESIEKFHNLVTVEKLK